MKKYIYYILLMFSSIVLLGACSDDDDDVKQIDVESIEVTNLGDEETILLLVGNNFQLKVTTLPANQQVNYYTSNANVVKVNKDGVLEPIDVGNADIMINAPNGEGFTQTKCAIKVITYVKEITMPLGNTYQILPIDATFNIKSYFQANPSNAENVSLKFKTSDPLLATVSDVGVVTAHGRGEVKISAYVEGGSTVESGTILFYTGYQNNLYSMTTWTATASTTYLPIYYGPEKIFTSSAWEMWRTQTSDPDPWLLVDMKEMKNFHRIYVSRNMGSPAITKVALYLSEANVDDLPHDDPSFVKLGEFSIPSTHFIEYDSFPGVTKKARYVKISILEKNTTAVYMSLNIFNAGLIE